MQDPRERSDGHSSREQSATDDRVRLASVSLPKGGGAIRGIGEKFSTNPVTGTASFTVPVYTSPGRAGFGPQLSLSYDSGSGNGPFGIGWQLAVPAITRKTDKGLPRYQDATESDVFILSGSEDLVPLLHGGRRDPQLRSLGTSTYRVQRYRPRIEALFARIERWTDVATGISHWRSISRDNVTTVYGPDGLSRVADPDDPRRIFSWLIAERFDDRGNAMLYRYAAESSRGVDTSASHERNRTDRSRSAQRYLKRILYGNRTPRRSGEDLSARTDWMFDVRLDYGEDQYVRADPSRAADEQPDFVWVAAQGRTDAAGQPAWTLRHDPFSTHRAGFETRTYRRCERVLMFHRFDQLGAEPYLVRSTEFTYAASGGDGYDRPSCIEKATQSGYVAIEPANVIERDGIRYRRYLKQSLPALEFQYSQPHIDERIRDIDASSFDGLPSGLDDTAYQWVDLDGEGLSGVLAESGSGWYYKRNLSPLAGIPKLGAAARVDAKPAATLAAGQAQLLDLAGNGLIDVVQFSGAVRGFFERTPDGSWTAWQTLRSIPAIDFQSPDVRFVDLDGDGHADVLITEENALTWYPSLGEDGFGAARHVFTARDEERGPRLVFSDGTQSIYLADLCGDGLTDLVRIRNGEVCYWPNLGYGRFGPKVTMDNAPRLDHADQFDQRRVRLADIDGSGTADIIYVGEEGVRLYFNRWGNSWSEARELPNLPLTRSSSQLAVVDLFGNGTSCLVWSSSLPAAAAAPMRYIDLMNGQKPHLLTGVRNNLGAETRIHYASSTKFYLEDRVAEKPWITRLPFPVQVVHRVETWDWISRCRFVTRYAYHHGYFDGEEREFRGFGCVEQWDTEEFSSRGDAVGPFAPANASPLWRVPAIHTRTWFHTGAYLDAPKISRHFEREYFRGDGAAALPDSVLPDGLDPALAREAIRALKGSILRQEIYADDGSNAAARPYRVSERSYGLRLLQDRGPNEAGVFLTHALETLDADYERTLFTVSGTQRPDPRVSHTVVLDVDDYGNVLQTVAAGYGRRYADETGLLNPGDAAVQGSTLATVTEARVTRTVDAPDAFRAPIPYASLTYELLKIGTPAAGTTFSVGEWIEIVRRAGDRAHDIAYEDVAGAAATTNHPHRRPIERTLTLFRPDDCGASANDPDTLLAPGELESRALPGESYKLALTPGLIADVYRRAAENLVPDSGVLRSAGYRSIDGGWWIPSGRIYYSSGALDDAATELARAEAHFFTPVRFHDAFFHRGSFRTELVVRHDEYDLLAIETADVLGNRTTAGALDYRVLQAARVTDPNGDAIEAQFDALGLVCATAVLGSSTDATGNALGASRPELTTAALDAFIASADAQTARALLSTASTRVVYDLHRFARSARAHPADPSRWEPTCVVSITREMHVNRVPGGEVSPLQVSWSYSDGFGREIQKKTQAEPDAGGSARWVGTGWTIFNNKGNPIQKYEPFFTATHRFEFAVTKGVTATMFYDPLDRAIATLHPDHTYSKLTFDPWRQETWDANDTVKLDPRADPDVRHLVSGYLAMLDTPVGAWRTWYQRRTDATAAAADRDAATKAADHAGSQALAFFDSLGRTFLTAAKNGTGPADTYCSRIVLDIEGNQRSVLDARDRLVMRYRYDMLGNRVHQASMEAGERWTLMDAAGKPSRTWDSRGHNFVTTYDVLHRVTALQVRGTDAARSDPRTLTRDVIVEKVEYGDTAPSPEASRLRSRVWKQYDAAGVVTSERYDVDGNLTRSTRQVIGEYKALTDWSSATPSGDTFATDTFFDALRRPVTLTTHDATVVAYAYNEAGLLNSVRANLRGAKENGVPVWTAFVSNIDYDEKGQRKAIDYGNRVRMDYSYDPETFRLTHLLTRRRAADFPDDCPVPPPNGWPGCQAQNLHYTYDPAGNITRIRDEAQQTVFFRNKRVEPTADYTYDALYRLVKATGREHLGLKSTTTPGPPTATRHGDAPRTGLAHPADGNAMGTYEQTYVYDKAGNIERMAHRGTDPSDPGWTRTYTYAEDSLLEGPSRKSNRLTKTVLSPNSPQPLDEPYAHDAHGNMTSMLHLQAMQWDFKDQLQMTTRQRVNAEDAGGAARQGERTYYVYDAAGQRVRKVTELANGGIKDERIYVGGFEVYRSYGAAPIERESLHLMDDESRIALVEWKTKEGPAVFSDPAPVIRYQLGNHLGSSSLELDEKGELITYEEFYPYGSTSCQITRGSATPKRYRYSGKERDEESELYYYGSRYYAPWIGRWTACDPAGLRDGLNGFTFCRLSPTVFFDPNGKEAEVSEFRQKRVLRRIARQHANSMTQAETEIKWSFEKYGLNYLQWRREVGVRAHEITQAWAVKNIPGAQVPTAKMKGVSGDTVPDLLLTKEKLVVELTAQDSTFLLENKQVQIAKQLEVAARLGYGHAQVADGTWAMVSAKNVRATVESAGWTDTVTDLAAKSQALGVLMGAISLLSVYTEMKLAEIESEDEDSFDPLAEETAGQAQALVIGTAGAYVFSLIGGPVVGLVGGLVIASMAHESAKENMGHKNDIAAEQADGAYEWRVDDKEEARPKQ